MRDVNLAGAWRLSGETPWEDGDAIDPIACRVPGDALYALEEAGLIAPARTAQEMRAREWASRRIWTYACTFTLPEEPYEGRSEKHFLQLRVAGRGSALIDGLEVGRFFGPWRESVLDVTRFLEDGQTHSIVLRIEQPMEEEGPAPRAGVLDARVRSVAFLRIEALRARVEGDKLIADACVEGFSSGRVNLRYRVLLGDELTAAFDAQEKLIADRQSYRHEIPLPDAQVWRAGERGAYTLRLSVERGGVRCDEGQISVAVRRHTFAPPAGHIAALPYALYDGENQVFLRGVNVAAPVTALELTSFARAGANLVRFHGAMPPDDAALQACDALGLNVWLEVPPDPSYAADAARRLAAHPCGALLSAGHGLAGPDGAPAGPMHPAAYAVREAALAQNPTLTVLPSSPSGPVAELLERYEGRGLCHDVHGPLDYAEDLYARLDAADALLLSKVGFSAPQRLPSGDWRAQGAGFLAWMEALCGPLPDQEAYVRVGCHMQAETLRYAALSARRREGGGCAGAIIWRGNAPEAGAISHALLDADGLERPALWALSRAWAPVAVSAKLDKSWFLRGEPLRAEVFLHVPAGGAGLYAVSAQIVDVRGVALEEGLWQVSARAACSRAGELALALAFDAPDLLFLRLKVAQWEETLFQDTYTICIPHEGEPVFAPLLRLPAAKPSVGLRDGAAELVNDGPFALLGATVHAGRELLCGGVVMPWERIPLRLPEGVLPESLRLGAMNLLPQG